MENAYNYASWVKNNTVMLSESSMRSHVGILFYALQKVKYKHTSISISLFSTRIKQ